jgi:hypothetical protein
VTSPYKRKILEREINSKQTNKQITKKEKLQPSSEEIKYNPKKRRSSYPTLREDDTTVRV